MLLPIKVLAVPAMASPTCQISGTVLTSLQQTKQLLNLGGFQNGPISSISYYEIKFKFSNQPKEINPVNNGQNCKTLYPKGEEKVLVYLRDEYNKQPVKDGDYISGNVVFGGDERFDGHFLSEVKILPFEAKTVNWIYYIGGLMVILIATIVVIVLKKRSSNI